MEESKRPKKRIRMPIGYRFCPTDEEIIIHYLRPKVFSFPLPSPFPLPGDPKEKRYFFCKTSFNHLHHHYHHVSEGYWKPIRKKVIVASRCNHAIGFKISFVFYHFSNHKTPWILQQFHLLYPIPLKMEEEWVVCSIQFKSKKPKTQLGPHHQDINSNNFTAQPAGSSCSSGITFEHNVDEEEDVGS